MNSDNITQNNGEDSTSTKSSSKPSEASEPSEVTDEEIEQQFSELGRITKENDGKIIKDENLEDVVIKDDMFSNLIKISNGFWFIVFGLLIIPVT